VTHPDGPAAYTIAYFATGLAHMLEIANDNGQQLCLFGATIDHHRGHPFQRLARMGWLLSRSRPDLGFKLLGKTLDAEHEYFAFVLEIQIQYRTRYATAIGYLLEGSIGISLGHEDIKGILKYFFLALLVLYGD
jgi:hypothetical protein